MSGGMSSARDAQDILQRNGIQYILSKKPEYTTSCPHCNGGYLSVKIDRDGVAWYCHSCKEGGGEKYDKPHSAGNGAHYWRHNGLGPIKAVFDYEDEEGKRLFQVLRFEPVGRPKDFRQRLGPDQEKWSIKGARIVPYRLPELVDDLSMWRTIFIVEGEKDVETLRSHGIPATTNPMGASKWREEWGAEFFKGADVVICPDNDQPGHDHGLMVARLLKPYAKLRYLDLKTIWPEIEPSDDISNWFEAGGSVEQLLAAIEDLPDWRDEAPAINDPIKPNGGTHPTEKQQKIPLISKADFLLDFKVPDYLIVGMLQRRFVYSFTGQTGHAKTAIALLCAELVASKKPGTKLGPHSVKKGQVVYFVGENPDDVRMRIIGADSLRAGEDPLADRIYFLPGVFEIPQMVDKVKQYIADVGGCDLVIVDTSAAYFFGKDEISNTEMGSHARMLRRLTELPGGPCVLVLCHPIKHAAEPSQLIPRGGGAFLFEIDGNLTAWKEGDLIELHHNKMRGPGFEPISFRLERVTCEKLTDTDGVQIPTVRAVPLDDAEADQEQTKTREDEDLLLAMLLKDPDQSMSKLVEICHAEDPTGKWGKSKIHRLFRKLSLQKPVLARKYRDHWQLTEEGKKVAREASLRGRREEGFDDQNLPPF